MVCVVVVAEPMWIDVLMDVLMHLLLQESHLTRNIVKMASSLLHSEFTLNSIQLITQVDLILICGNILSFLSNYCLVFEWGNLILFLISHAFLVFLSSEKVSHQGIGLDAQQHAYIV